MQRVMKDGLFGGGFGGPRCVGRPCRISAFPCSGGFPRGIKREWVEKAGKPYDIDNRTRRPRRALPATRYRRASAGSGTRASVEHAQTFSRKVLILGDSRNPPVNSRRANEARTSARSCRVSISLHHRPLMRTVFTSSVEAIRLMTS